MAPGESGSELKLDAPGDGEGHRAGRRAISTRTSRPRPARSTTRPLDEKPYWDLERARIGDTRKVPVEVIVNGQPVAKTEITADGNDPGRLVRRADREVELGRAAGLSRRRTPTRSSSRSAASRSGPRRNRPSGA